MHLSRKPRYKYNWPLGLFCNPLCLLAWTYLIQASSSDMTYPFKLQDGDDRTVSLVNSRISQVAFMRRGADCEDVRKGLGEVED